MGEYKLLPTILFNLVETALVCLLGYLLGLDWQSILVVLLSFTVVRMTIKKAKHFKSWQKCLIWTTAMFCSLFLVCSIDLFLSVLLSAFAAIIISGHADIVDAYQWSPHIERKHRLRAIKTLDEFELVVSQALLKPKYRILLRYLYRDDYSLSQAAEALGVEYPTVKAWHGEALAKLF